MMIKCRYDICLKLQKTTLGSNEIECDLDTHPQILYLLMEMNTTFDVLDNRDRFYSTGYF